MMSAMPGGLVLQPQHFGMMGGQPMAMAGMGGQLMPAGLMGLGAMAQQQQQHQQHLMEAAAAAAADRVSPTSASSASPALASAASANAGLNADPADDERTAEYLRELQAEKESLEAKRSDEEDARTKHAVKLLEQEILRAQQSGYWSAGSSSSAAAYRDNIKYLDVYRERPIRLTVRVLVPVREHPKFNFVGKLLGPKGNSMKRLQEETMTKMAVLGRGSMRDKQKEEELRACADPKYQHLHEDLHVEITAFAPPAEAHARIAYALTEVRKYLIPDSNDEIRQEQMREMELLAVGGVVPSEAAVIAAAANNNNGGGVPNGCFDPLKRALSAYAAAAAAANGMYAPTGTAPAPNASVPASSVQCAASALPVQSLQSLQSQYSAAMLRAAASGAAPGLSMQTISAAPYLSASPIVMRQREDIPKDGYYGEGDPCPSAQQTSQAQSQAAVFWPQPNPTHLHAASLKAVSNAYSDRAKIRQQSAPYSRPT